MARSYAALKRRGEFLAVRKRGKAKARPTMLVYRLPAPGQAQARAGITVDTRIGKAVVRNMVRRRIAAALQELLAGHTGERLLVVARPAAAAANFHVLRSDLRSALEAA
ncbi:MAG TPA: ribonuclease P protein component [Polyangiales bacterium]|nr:ribonuclease P protein component [Polyangiales bacterium]